MLNVRVYLNSGFNNVNVPYSPTLLDECAYLDLPAIDTLQDGILPFVNLRVSSFNQISTADYCKVGEWYYAIIGITMTSMDVVTLSLKPDYILTAGGVENLVFLDGITERVHVAKSDDVFAAYTLDDPYTTPSEPLMLESGSHTTTPAGVVIIESTLDLLLVQSTHSAITFSDLTSGEDVTVPQIPAIQTATNHKYGGAHGTISYVLGTVAVDGTITINNLVSEGLNMARSLGVESCITATYVLPVTMFNGVGTNWYATQDGISDVVDTNSQAWSGFSKYEYATVQNKRVLYGDCNKYGILTTAGNRSENAPEVIYKQGDVAPSIVRAVDARAEGNPYYRFRYYFGNDGWDADGDDVSNNFWQTAIAGSGWQVVPLVFNGKSGATVAQTLFEGKRVGVDTAYQVGKDMIAINAIGKVLGSAIGADWGDTSTVYGTNGYLEVPNSAVNAMWGNSLPRSYGGGMGNVPNIGTGVSAIQMAGAGATAALGATIQKATLDVGYNYQKDYDYVSFLTSQNIVAPEVAVTYNTSIVRDAIGNGYYFYRYRYSDNDLARIDKLLTEYGYRVTKPLEVSDFNNRAKFNYVKAHGVSVGSLPAWWANGVAAQLAGGQRFWHVLPDTKYYTDGTNI